MPLYEFFPIPGAAPPSGRPVWQPSLPPPPYCLVSSLPGPPCLPPKTACLPPSHPLPRAGLAGQSCASQVFAAPAQKSLGCRALTFGRRYGCGGRKSAGDGGASLSPAPMSQGTRQWVARGRRCSRVGNDMTGRAQAASSHPHCSSRRLIIGSRHRIEGAEKGRIAAPIRVMPCAAAQASSTRFFPAAFATYTAPSARCTTEP